MKIIFATWLVDKTLSQALTKNNVTNRLISYHFVMEQCPKEKQLETLNKYVKTGSNFEVTK